MYEQNHNINGGVFNVGGTLLLNSRERVAIFFF